MDDSRRHAAAERAGPSARCKELVSSAGAAHAAVLGCQDEASFLQAEASSSLPTRVPIKRSELFVGGPRLLGSSSQCLPTEDVYCSLGMLVWHVDDVKLELGVSIASEIGLDGSPKIPNTSSSTQQTHGARNTVRLLVGAAPGPAAMGRYIGHGGGLGPSKAREASPGIAVYGPPTNIQQPGMLGP